MNLILCGLPGSGKTAVGQLLAQRLNKNFIDTDKLLEQWQYMQTDKWMTCREIARSEGEDRFRILENTVVAGAVTFKDCVIATGGGTLLQQENVRLLKSLGKIVYLKAYPGVVLPRLLQNGMPTYLDALDPVGSFDKLADHRSPIYEQACHLMVDTQNLTLDQIVERITQQTKG